MEVSLLRMAQSSKFENQEKKKKKQLYAKEARMDGHGDRKWYGGGALAEAERL